MAEANTRKRIFMIAQMLYNETDENHPLTTIEIVEKLKEQNLSIDLKTFREDIAFLLDHSDFDIIKVRSSPNKYFWGERLFELPELKLLIDAVSSSFFINKTKSKKLIKKLTLLGGTYHADILNRNVYGAGKVKTDNRKIYFIVDTINEAINLKQKIRFQYYDYNGKKEKILRNNGERYILSPYALYWNEGNYYVVGYSEKREAVIPFRVDRMARTAMINEEAVEKPEDFNIDDYGKKIFKMFDGEEIRVRLDCRNDLMKYLLDRFGKEVEVISNDDERFIAEASVGLSPTFYGWIFQFGGEMKIIGPEKAVAGFKDMIEKNSTRK